MSLFGIFIILMLGISILALAAHLFHNERMRRDYKDLIAARRVREQCDEFDRLQLLPGERLEPIPRGYVYDGVRRLDFD